MSIVIKSSEKGAELNSVKFNGIEKLHEGKTFWDRQAPVLFPTVGRLKNNKTIIENKEYEIEQHGFAKDREFRLIEKTDNFHKYILKSNIETLLKYPYKFELYVEYVIIDNSLETRYTVVNTDKKDMIFGIGGHPGFKLEKTQEEYYFELEEEEDSIEFMEVEGDYISDFPAKNILKNNKIIEITKNTFKNDAIMMKKIKSKTITLKEKQGNKKVLEFNFEDFPILAIWSIPNARFICIEPWFNYADKVNEMGAFENKEGVILLKSNEKFNCKYSVRFF